MNQRSEPIILLSLIALPAQRATLAQLQQSIAAQLDRELSRIGGELEVLLRQLAAQPVPDPALTAQAALLQRASASVEYQKEQLLLQPLPTATEPALVPSPVTGRIVSLEYEDDETKTDLLKLTLDNRNLDLFEHPIAHEGTELAVTWGYPGRLAPMRTVVVSAIKGGLSLTVEAQDKGFVMHKVQRTRTFKNLKRSDVAKQVAREYGYGADALHIEDTQVVFPVIPQAAETDAQFLKKLANKEGLEFFVDFDGFHWHRRATGQAPLRTFTYYLPPGHGEVVSFSVDSDAKGKKKAGKVGKKGTDPKTGKPVAVTADKESTPRTTLQPKQEAVAAKEPGPEVRRVIDPETKQLRTVHVLPPVNISAGGDGVGDTTSGPSVTSKPEVAKREADAQFRKTQQETHTLTLTLVGDPSLVAKAVVEVRGLGARLSGKYYVTSAKHTLKGTYEVVLKCKTDGGGNGTTANTAAKPNTKPAPEGEPFGPPTASEAAKAPPLTRVQVIDPVTKQTSWVYKDTAGRSST